MIGNKLIEIALMLKEHSLVGLRYFLSKFWFHNEWETIRKDWIKTFKTWLFKNLILHFVKPVLSRWFENMMEKAELRFRWHFISYLRKDFVNWNHKMSQSSLFEARQQLLRRRFFLLSFDCRRSIGRLFWTNSLVSVLNHSFQFLMIKMNQSI